MGFSIAWLAVKDADPESLYGDLGVRPTGEPDEHFESPLTGGRLHPWFLLIGQRCDHRIIDDAFLTQLSANRELVACSIEEHVMFSSAAGWQNGRCSWSIVHDAQRGIFDLSTTGQPPEVFEQIRSDLIAGQRAEGGEDAQVDLVFDIPLQVAKSLVGFKHDEDTEWVDQRIFHTFEDVAPRRELPKPWWKFL